MPTYRFFLHGYLDCELEDEFGDDLLPSRTPEACLHFLQDMTFSLADVWGFDIWALQRAIRPLTPTEAEEAARTEGKKAVQKSREQQFLWPHGLDAQLYAEFAQETERKAHE